MCKVGAEIIQGPVGQPHSWSLGLGLMEGGRELHCSLQTQLEGMNVSPGKGEPGQEGAAGTGPVVQWDRPEAA